MIMATERVDADAFEADSYDDEAVRVNVRTVARETPVIGYNPAPSMNYPVEAPELTYVGSGPGTIVVVVTSSKSGLLSKALNKPLIEYEYGQHES